MKQIDGSKVALACMLLLSQMPVGMAQGIQEEEDLALSFGDKSTISLVTGRQQSLRRAPAVASVITAADIAAMGASDLDEVLETIPGIHVSHSANNFSPLFVIRGIYSQLNPQTLLLQNGVPMTALQQGNRGSFWGNYPVDNIARIEVIRGPGSALYGADAYAGVINIITKSAADMPGTQVGARVGSFGSRDAWVQHGGQLGALEVAGYLRLGSTDGFKEIIKADAQTRNDRLFPTGSNKSRAPGAVNTGKDSADANLELVYKKWRLRGGYKLRDNLETGAGIASALDSVGNSKSQRFTSDLSWDDPQFAKDWGAGVTASYMEYAQSVPVPYQLLPPGARTATGVFVDGMLAAPATSERQSRLSAFVSYTGFSDHSLRFGIGHDDLDMYKVEEYRNFRYNAGGAPVPAGGLVLYPGDSAFLSPHQRQVNYVYAQDEWSLAKDWALTFGLRRDVFSDAGGTTNPRVALVWDAAYDLTAKLLYGAAFRAPSFAELYSINNPVNRGSLNVRPETIKTMEAAFSWQAHKDTQVNLNFFNYNMQDIIRAVANPAPTPGSTVTNTGEQEGKGFEIEVVWDASRSVRLTSNYAYQVSIDKATQLDAGYAPHKHLYARGDWQLGSGLMLSPQINWVADRKRAGGDARPSIPDYTTVDLTLRTSSGKKRWEFAGSVRNLFNATVLEPSLAPGVAIPDDLPMAPRTLYVQATYRL